jgi:ribulose 1,5-bisphosphate carboxylase large subunit-like protein
MEFDYLAIGEEIDPEGYVLTTYSVKTDLKIEKAARAIAAEQSTGTWTDISTTLEYRRHLRRTTLVLHSGSKA